MLKYVLLGVLSYQPLTGYQIKQFMDNAAGHFWHAQMSQIYRTLDALEKDDAITSTIQPQEIRPDRRVYEITQAGMDDLIAWLSEPMTTIAQNKDELMIRMYFAANVDRSVVLAQLHVQRALHQKQLHLYRNEIPQMIREGSQQNPHLAKDAIMWDITRRNGELLEEAYLRWLDETIERIEDME